MPTIDLDLSILPVNAQQELLDFYEFLQEKYSTKSSLSNSRDKTRSISRPNDQE